MFRAVKDLIETLKMELGKIDIVDQNLSILTDAVNFEIPKANATIVEEKINIDVKEALYSSEDLNVMTATFDSNIEVHNVQALSINSAVLKNLELESYKELSILFVKPIEEKVRIEDIPVQYEKSVNVFSLNMTSSKIQSGEHIGEIWKLTVKKSKFMKKEKVLSALEKILKSYKGRVENLKFVGYFKNVPLGRAGKIIAVGEDLVVFLKRKGRDLKADVVVVKSPEKIMIEVVR